MDDAELKKEVNRIKGLKGRKSASEAELQSQAIHNIRVRDFGEAHHFVDEEEKKTAKLKYASYLLNYKLDTISDLDTLADLVINETYKNRIEKQVKDYFEQNKISESEATSGKKNCYVPEKQLEAKRDLENHILSLKVKLGIDKEDQKEDDLTALELLKKRVQDHINSNPNDFVIYCKWCARPLLLWKKVKDFESLKMPWLAGRFLYNKPLIQLVKDKVLTVEQAASILHGAGEGENFNPAHHKEYCGDYINWCIRNQALIEDHLEEIKK